MGKFALLIGVGKYEDGLAPLPAAPNDVAALKEVLQNPNMGGFDEVKTIVNPVHAEMTREIELWFQGRETDDLVVLFFSGHGLKDERRNLYFAASNTEKKQNRLVRSTATSARFINECVQSCKANHQIIILDCCFSGAFGDMVARDDGEINLQDQLGAEGQVVLTSTSAVDYSFEEKGSSLSIYTRYLVEGISSGAADEDDEGVITVDKLHRYASRKVNETSPAMSPKLITLRDEGYRIRLSRAPQGDPKLIYRKKADQKASAGQFSIPAQRLLLSLRRELGISDEEAEAIEAEVLKPYQAYQHKRQVYADTLRQCLQEETTLSPHVIRDLMDLRVHLRLKPEDALQLDKDLLGVTLENYQSQIEKNLDEQSQELRNHKLQQYREGFIKAIETSYPLDKYVSDGLKKFQHYLELSNEDVAAIEQPIRRSAEEKQQKHLQEQKDVKQKPPTTDTEYRQKNALNQRKSQEKLEQSHTAAMFLQQRNVDDLSSTRFGANYYAKLRELLAEKKWKAADQETATRMCEIMNCQKEGLLRIEDIENFPSHDLCIIDRLWVKYSNDHFGFSVQKQIWHECGSPEPSGLQELADLSLNTVGDIAGSQRAWGKFCVTLGWMTRSMFMGLVGPEVKPYWLLTFDESAPKGHLPVSGLYRLDGKLGILRNRFWYSLLSRPDL